MRIPVLLALILIAAPVKAEQATVIPVSKPSWCEASSEARVRAAIVLNQYRRSEGLREVVLDEALDMAADAHSADLAAWGKLSHQGSDGANFVDRAERAQFRGVPRAENVAWNLRSPDAVVKAWWDSPGHKANMLLPDVTHVGIGSACSPQKGHFWTMVLGRKGGRVTYASLR